MSLLHGQAHSLILHEVVGNAWAASKDGDLGGGVGWEVSRPGGKREKARQEAAAFSCLPRGWARHVRRVSVEGESSGKLLFCFFVFFPGSFLRQGFYR